MLVAILVFRLWLRHRPSPEELERRRRIAINRVGKMADGTVIDVDDAAITFSYDVRGVEYTASQDISALLDLFPPDRCSVAGPVAVKFDSRNPANSIVLCEDWSGLRHMPAIRKEH